MAKKKYILFPDFQKYRAENIQHYKGEIEKELLDINLYREWIYGIVLSTWNLLMVVYLWIEKANDGWIKNLSYGHLFYIHVVFTVIFSLLLLTNYLYVGNKKIIKNISYVKFLNLGFTMAFLMWASISSVISAPITEISMLYVVAVFLVSATIRLNLRDSLFCYVIPLAVMLILVCLSENPQVVKEVYIIKVVIVNIFLFAFSKILYSSFVNDFVNRKSLNEKNIELEAAKEELTKAVKKRTEELVEANEQLIQEINKMHTMEMEIFKAKLENQDQERLLNEAKEYERIRGEFFANVSHEFRTPLNIIFCTIQMMDFYLLKKPSEDNTEKVNKHIESMKQNCYRLVRLVNNLIDITKINAGYFELNLSNNDIVKIVEDITLSLNEYIASFDITLSFETALNERKIACDPEIIERIILNLLSNAVKFTEPGGKIDVKLYTGKDMVVIKVIDDGIGIPYEKQKFIFERFAQVDRSLTRQKEGSGIGLSLVKSLVELHEGKISVTSDGIKGSEFEILLPDKLIDQADSICAEKYSFDNKAEIIDIEFSDIYKDVD